MSLIHTAELNHIAPFDYLVASQRHAAALAANPADWMPWNYQAPLEIAGPTKIVGVSTPVRIIVIDALEHFA
jgi:hypothetical protein